jgi:hypothetical protein
MWKSIGRFHPPQIPKNELIISSQKSHRDTCIPVFAAHQPKYGLSPGTHPEWKTEIRSRDTKRVVCSHEEGWSQLVCGEIKDPPLR